jgi:hypothetical protein
LTDVSRLISARNLLGLYCLAQRREDKQNDADELDSEKEGENEPARGPQQKIDEESDKQAHGETIFSVVSSLSRY